MARSKKELVDDIVEFLESESYRGEVELALSDFDDVREQAFVEEANAPARCMIVEGLGMYCLAESFKCAERGSEKARAFIRELAGLLT